MDPLELGKLLCHCLSLETDEIEAERFERVSDADWRGLVQLAARYGLAPLLHRRLKAHSADIVMPPEIRRTLRETYLHSSGVSMRLYHQLAGVLMALQEEGISVIVLKGGYLAQAVYGNPAFRPMQDVDLLVRRDDLPRAEEKLIEMGYRLYGDRERYAEEHFHFLYMPSESGYLPIEIHWHILEPDAYPKLDIAELWERALPARVANVDVLILSAEDSLLHLCIHTAYGHAFEDGLRFSHDVAQIIRHCRAGVNWEQLEHRAQRWRADKCAYLALCLARDLFGVTVAGDVLRRLKPTDLDDRFLDWAKDRAFASLDDTIIPEFENWGQLGTSKKFGQRVMVFLRACFPPKRVLAERYGVSPRSTRIYLCYLVYLKYLLYEHAPRIWMLLRGDDQMKEWLEDQGRRVEKRTVKRGEMEALAQWLSSD